MKPAKIRQSLGDLTMPQIPDERQLLEKIRRLPPEKLKEVEDFVDYLGERDAREDRAFMRAVVQGLADIESGKSVTLSEAKKRLGLA